MLFIIFIKKNIVPTTKLINVATNAVVFFPSSPFIKASNDVETPANVANIIANIFFILSLQTYKLINFMIQAIY